MGRLKGREKVEGERIRGEGKAEKMRKTEERGEVDRVGTIGSDNKEKKKKKSG